MFLQPGWLGVLLLWCFIVLSAVQLTIRLGSWSGRRWRWR
jgi:hypothetical protein